MLISIKAHIKHRTPPASPLQKRGRQVCATIKWNNLSLLPCIYAQNHCGTSIRNTKTSSQILGKMGNIGVLEDHLEQKPLSSSYETAMEALSSLINSQKRGDRKAVDGKYGKLDRMLMYLRILGLEEKLTALKVIHVAGTKGKGSTCSFCEAILHECGFRTGLFTSPHLIDVRERFRINGFDISEDLFLQYFWDCWNLLKENLPDDLPMPPLFQFLTVLAFKIFICEKVDVAIVEVGLGGKNDSTNVIREPVVCGITSLGMDHTELLGDTLGQITLHKAGIFKPRVPAFTAPQLTEAMDVLEEKARELMVPLEVAVPLAPENLDGLKLSLSGDHQLINAGLAVSLARSWLQRTGYWEGLLQKDTQLVDLPHAFLRGLSTARLPGRAQIVHDPTFNSGCSSELTQQPPGDLIFYLDGAHSPESMEFCARWFSNAVTESQRSSSSLCKVGLQEDNGYGQHAKTTEESRRITKRILLFNCMEVRDPQVLLPSLINACASSGTYFSKALFVPSMSTYNKVTSGASVIPINNLKKDLSWQFNLQRIWEKISHRNGIVLENGSHMCSLESMPPHKFLYEDASHCCPTNKAFTRSAVMPSLPLTINWLRDCVKENPSLKVQVLVTGSLHLVGDVLKLLKR